MTILQGDSTTVLKDINDESIDLIVTDPPYALVSEEYREGKNHKGGFMGKEWDKALPSVEIWKECYRVLKQGKLAFVMCSPRQDVLSRMIINLEDAGFRTNYSSLFWTYGSGFPKAMNIERYLLKKLTAELKSKYGLSEEEIEWMD